MFVKNFVFLTYKMVSLQYSEMEENPICIQIPWYNKPDQLAAWEEGQTGYPFIDACMRQLRKVDKRIHAVNI